MLVIRLTSACKLQGARYEKGTTLSTNQGIAIGLLENAIRAGLAEEVFRGDPVSSLAMTADMKPDQIAAKMDAGKKAAEDRPPFA